MSKNIIVFFDNSLGILKPILFMANRFCVFLCSSLIVLGDATIAQSIWETRKTKKKRNKCISHFPNRQDNPSTQGRALLVQSYELKKMENQFTTIPLIYWIKTKRKSQQITQTCLLINRFGGHYLKEEIKYPMYVNSKD